MHAGLRAYALGFIACGVLSGCGHGGAEALASKSARTILALAKGAADRARSVHLTGTNVSNGKLITVDAELVPGRGGRTRFSAGRDTADLLTVGANTYALINASLLREIPPAAARVLLRRHVTGKWLKISSSDPRFASVVKATDFHSLVDDMLSHLGHLTKGSTSVIDGQRAISITDAAQGLMLYVAIKGSPYPLEMVGNFAGVNGRLAFDRWNSPVSLTAPASSVSLH